MSLLVAFVAHAPGMRLIYGRRLGPQTARQNVAAIAVTLVAMVGAYATSRSALAAVLAWAVGHCAWGAWLARRVARGRYAV